MWTWITDKRSDAERVLTEIVGPLVRRDPAELRGRICVGPADECAELLSRYARAGCERIHFWPVGDERRQVELIAGDIALRLSHRRWPPAVSGPAQVSRSATADGHRAVPGVLNRHAVLCINTRDVTGDWRTERAHADSADIERLQQPDPARSVSWPTAGTRCRSSSRWATR
jgi:hypothetical protein